MKFLPFGNFESFCHDSPLPACNLMNIPKKHGIIGVHGKIIIGDLGSIFIDICAIAVTALLIWRANKREAAVGRREFQIFLGLYELICLCDIFTTGRFLGRSNDATRSAAVGFSAVQIAAITAAFWVLLLNSLVSLQIMADGTARSIALVAGSAFIVFSVTVAIAMDTAFSPNSPFQTNNSVNIALYILYIILPLLCIISYFIVNVAVVLKTLREPRYLWRLCLAAFLFIVGQVFEFVVSKYISTGTHGAIDGAMFQTIFTLAAVISLWFYWCRITDDDWPIPLTGDCPPSNLESLLYEVKCVLRTASKTMSAPSIKISRHISMSMEQSLDALERHKAAFLDVVEREVRDLVASTERLDLTSIVATSQAGSRTIKMEPNSRRAWTRRFTRMARHESTSLPTFDGEILDSWLTEPIMAAVNRVRTRFLQAYSHIVCQALVGLLRDSPTTQREFALQFAACLRDLSLSPSVAAATASEPLSDAASKALVHLLRAHLSGPAVDKLSLQVGRHLSRRRGGGSSAVSSSAISAFTATLVPAFHAALQKLLLRMPAIGGIKSSIVSAGGKSVSKVVTTAVVAHIAAHAGVQLTGGMIWAMTLPTAAIFAAVELEDLPERIADRIAVAVRRVVAEEFRKDNRTALRLIFKDAFKDGGRAISEMILMGGMAREQARKAAREMLAAAEKEEIQLSMN